MPPLAILALSFLTFAGSARAAAPAGTNVVFVNGSLATGRNDGSSWDDALRGPDALRNGLALASSGDELWIAAGTYDPAPPGGDPGLSFDVGPGVALRGGFAGGETALDERDPAANPTILCGDLDGNDPSTVTLENRFSLLRSDNSVHVVRILNATPPVLLDALVVRAGFGGDGANVTIAGGTVSLTGCTLERGVSTGLAGALAASDAALTVEDCTVHNNSGAQTAAGVALLDAGTILVRGSSFTESVQGSALYVGPSSFCDPPVGVTAQIEACSFTGNQGGFSPGGAGICTAGATATITDCSFVGNRAAGGGGVFLSKGDVLVDRCDFVANEQDGDGGGGIYLANGEIFCFGGPRLGTLRVANSRFVGNETALVSIGDSTLTGCTFTRNGAFAPFVGDGFFVQEGTCVLENCIVWNTSVPSQPLDVDFRAVAGGDFEFRSCLLENWDQSFPGDAIDEDPRFADFEGPDGIAGNADDDLRLAPWSPAVDAGRNDLVQGDADFGGGRRVRDGDRDGAPVVDIGAFERRAMRQRAPE